MARHKKVFAVLVTFGWLCGFTVASLPAQEPNPTAQMAPGQNPDKIEKQDNGIYLYRVKGVQRDLDAVNYLHRSGSTNISFVGTQLMPFAKGDAKVTSERG